MAEQGWLWKLLDRPFTDPDTARAMDALRAELRRWLAAHLPA